MTSIVINEQQTTIGIGASVTNVVSVNEQKASSIIVAQGNSNQTVIQEQTPSVIETDVVINNVTVLAPSNPTVQLSATGLQGPAGPAGQSGLIVDESAKVDKSIVYYDASSQKFLANANWTTNTLTDGGNF